MVIQRKTDSSKSAAPGAILFKNMRAKTTQYTLMLFVALVGLLHFQSASADPRYYHVEVIIFADANGKYLNSEHWPQKPATLSSFSANEALEPIVSSRSKPGTNAATNNASIFQNTSPAILTEEAKRISDSKHYQMLFYGSWTQQGLDSQHAINIDLEQLTNYGDVRTKNTITGELKIVLARYLHIYSNLQYIPEHTQSIVKQAMKTETVTEPAPAVTNEPMLVDYYPIKNHRRMRSKVLHYIDHPLVGILVQINPVENVTPDN